MQQKKPAKAWTLTDGLPIIGILFIIGSAVIGFKIDCPTPIQCILFYTLIGMGMACVFFKSAGQSSVSYKSLRFSFKIVGCLAVPFLIFILNPIDKIKANGCGAPVEVVKSGSDESPQGIMQQPPLEKSPDSRQEPSKVNKRDTIWLQPPVVGTINPSVRCKGITKKGTRCKHNTHIANGYCFQHQPG